MKITSLFTVIIVLLHLGLRAQIKYEGSVDSKYKTFQLDDNTYKYIKYNSLNESVLIFNLDNTLWRSVKLPLPEGHVPDEIKHISQHLFNNDDYAEVIYSCVVFPDAYYYENPEVEYAPLDFTLNIVSENCDTMLKVPGSNEMEIIKSKKGNKILVYKHMGKHFSKNEETLIYSF